MKNRRDHYVENRESDLGEIERTRKELAFVVRVGERSKNERISKATCEGTRRVAGNKRLANPRRQFNLAANPGENVNKDLRYHLGHPLPPGKQRLAVCVC